MEINKSIGRYFTFFESKKLPVYSWIRYKEGFSPKIVDLFAPYGAKNILDPFCGVGTTLLRCKELGIQSTGIDASPIAVLSSSVKTRNYSEEFQKGAEHTLKELMEKWKETERFKWKMPFKSLENAVPKRNREFIERMRKAIESIEDRKTREFFLLCLISIVPQCTMAIKDGGVLRTDRKKRSALAKDAFKRKAKRMIKECTSINGPEPYVEVGDARSIGFKEEFDAVITSPPYLNNVDYAKVYSMELSLMGEDYKRTSSELISSFVKRWAGNRVPKTDIPDECLSIPTASSYFADMEEVIERCREAIKPGGECVMIVGNSFINGEEIETDRIIKNISEQLGFESHIIVGLVRKAISGTRIAQIRESAIVMKKKG